MDQPKKKRCPNGERRDPRTGECVKISEKKNSKKKEKAIVEEGKKSKCKKGTRRNKKTGLCDPIVNVVQPAQKENSVVYSNEKIPNAQVAEKLPVSLSQESPVQESPVQESPVQESPVQEPPVQESPVQESPVQESPDVEENSQSAEDILYPTLEDPEFQTKISRHQEFADSKYEGAVKDMDIQTQADLMCTAKYELMPHQTFVKNFLSIQTPYNSLLLFHMLGTGKTCSAIGIAEEMRKYLQQVGSNKKIIVIASPNVQSNFRKELFDDRKLIEVNGIWTMDRTCIGNSLLREINPTNIKGLEKRHIIQQIDAIILQHYDFMGYGTFFNKMRKLKIVTPENTIDKTKVRRFFDKQLVIIDEVHNIRVDDTNNKDSKRVGVLLQEIAKYSENMRLLLLSATPMYNSPTEIVWLTNLMNAVDGRPPIRVKDVFTASGELRDRALLVRKLTGYVSFVRGENPYLFPFRVYPDIFDSARLIGSADFPKPTMQMNEKEIADPIRQVPVYMNPVGDYQKRGYDFILENIVQKMYVRDKTGKIREKNAGIFENMESFGYTMLNNPIQSLNMVYPSEHLDQVLQQLDSNPENPQQINAEDLISSLIGKGGLDRTMKYQVEETPPRKFNFEYKDEKTRFFSPTELPRYGAKIARICECIRNSTGIVLVYSQYIDGGIVPIALALEEMGMTRYASDESHRNLNLLKKTKGSQRQEIDAVTMRTRQEMGQNVMNFKPAKYVMITGDKYYSANKTADIKYVTRPENATGEFVKVILISKAVSEGVDFKNIRQIHILEPWYNMNRIEQTIGRAVRTRSHCDLPFSNRNVEIYLHASSSHTQPEMEAADLYLYRVAEKKAVQIGKVTRLLKQTAVDCVLNIAQSSFTAEELMKVAANERVVQHLSSRDLASGSQITIENFPVGDRPYTDICDYMETCELKCEAAFASPSEPTLIQETYSEDFLKTNTLVIMQKIRDLFKDRFVFTRDELVRSINLTKKYPIEHIYYALSNLVGRKTEELVDVYGRIGYLVNRGNVYAFQPIEIFDENATVFERMNPVDKKYPAMQFEVSTTILPTATESLSENSKDSELEKSERSESSESVAENPSQNALHHLVQSVEYVLQGNLKIAPGDKDWYKHLNKVSNVLVMSQIYSVPLDAICKYAVFHYLDMLKIAEKVAILLQIFQESGMFPFGKQVYDAIRDYFQQRMMVGSGSQQRYVVLADGLKNVVYKDTKLSETTTSTMIQWTEVTSYSELTKLQPIIKSMLEIREDMVYSKIGFMYPFKDQGVLFKIKDRMQKDKKNTQGAVCASAKKELIIQRINDVMGHVVYQNDKNFDVTDYCVMLEVVLRSKTEEYEKGGQLYFYSPEKAIFNKITEK